MTVFSSRPPASNQSGFTLLELLLVIGVASVLMLGISRIASSWMENEISTGAGQQMERIAVVVQRYVEANWTDLTATNDALSAGGVWANLRNNLDQEGLLINNNLRSTLNQPLQISYVIDTAGGQTTYRAAIFTTNPSPVKRVIDAARQAGTFGGTVAAFPSATNATGAFGQWSVPISSLLPSGAFPCAPGDGTSCLVALVSYSQSTLCGPFLYRTDVETTSICPSGNTMNTALLMNNNPIENASNIQTDDLNVNNLANLGTTNVAGVATMNGPTTASGGMTVNNGMTVSGDASFSNNVTMNGGTLNATSINANTIQAPQIETNDLNVQALNVTNGELTIDGDINVNGNVGVAGAGAELFVSNLNAGAINAGNGNIYAGKIDIQNSMQINGQVDVVNGAVVSDQMVVQGCVKIANGGGTYDNYGNCPP